jgi:outer membrane protein TolC
MRTLIVIACVPGCVSAGAADVIAVYRRAFQIDPQLREAKAHRRAAIEAKPQAQAELLPQNLAGSSAMREHDCGAASTTVPLISEPGGAVSSRVRQAVCLQRAAKERVERVARATERLARDSYLGMVTDASRIKALRQAVGSNGIALGTTEAGFEAGTRPAVHVLPARRLRVQNRANFSRSRYDYPINVLKLQQAAGILSEQSLSSVNTLLRESPPPVP